MSHNKPCLLGSTTTGLSATSNALSVSTNAVERVVVDSSGDVTVKNFTVAGVVCIEAGLQTILNNPVFRYITMRLVSCLPVSL
jgi:hypothetical protein